jgi:PAS domain S-box-containing protein
VASIETIHEGEELLRRLLEAVPGGVVHVAADGAIRHANREALRILGLRHEELTQRYVVDFETETILEDGSPCPAAEYPVAKVLATGKPHGATTIGVRHPDGAVAWAVFRAEPVLREDGELGGAVVTFIDITERKRREAALRSSEQKWRSLAEHSPDFVVIVDREVRITSINRTLPELEEAQVLGHSPLAFLDPNYVEEWRRHFDHVVASGETARFETRGLGPSGEMGWYDTSLVPLPAAGEVERVLVVARDVTERRTMLTSLAEKDRLASVGMLAASVAHEIMNPLTYVLASLDLAISDRLTDEERRRKAIADAREGAQRMQQIVWDLRSLGRSGAEDLFYVDVRAVVETALRLCGPDLVKGRNIVLDLGAVPGVLASESRLCQVFINLLVNAAQALEGDGVVRVRTRHDEAASLVGVDIEDTGAGIPPATLPRIFEPFYTTKRGGTGLGLSICRDIIERMGGRIDVKSAVGVGSTFTIWLSTSRAKT